MWKKLVFALSLILVSNQIGATRPIPNTKSVIIEDFDDYTQGLYNEINDSDLNFEALEVALKGYVKLQQENQIEALRFLTIIDMSLSANKKRFFLIDLKNRKLIHKSIVAHGRNSGGEFARHFSNKVGSYKSSIGFYRTAETYHGKHGLSLKLDGLEYSNSNARKRAIVIHAADYVSDQFIEDYGRLGRSLGCPSLPRENYDKIVEKIKNGSLLFMYYPEEHYLKHSAIANFNFDQFQDDFNSEGQ